MRVSRESLQDSCLFTAQGFRHHAYSAAPRLSIKCMFNGTATYRVGRDWFAVDETGYLILNEGQAYEIAIASPTRVESFVVYFPHGWSHDVLRPLVTPDDKLLDEPAAGCAEPVHFFEKFSPHDDIVSAGVADRRRAHRTGPLPDLLVEG